MIRTEREMNDAEDIARLESEVRSLERVREADGRHIAQLKRELGGERASREFVEEALRDAREQIQGLQLALEEAREELAAEQEDSRNWYKMFKEANEERLAAEARLAEARERYDLLAQDYAGADADRRGYEARLAAVARDVEELHRKGRIAGNPYRELRAALSAPAEPRIDVLSHSPEHVFYSVPSKPKS